MEEEEALADPVRLPGSFRDPSGHIYSFENRVLRSVSHGAAGEYEASRQTLNELVTQGMLVDFRELSPEEFGMEQGGNAYVLEHPKLAPWTYPYEWSFSLLQRAALFHLELHLYLLERGLNLSDASAYNVQFQGTEPVFIDHLSVRPYRDGEFWLGHRQFCEQFLNPLLLRAHLDIAHNAWYRGNLEGIATNDLARLLPMRSRFGWKVLSNVVLPAYFQKNTTSDREVSFTTEGRRLPLAGLQSMLRQLHTWIGALRPANTRSTTWANYASTTTYDDDETTRKKEFIATFIQQSGARTVIDLGCNTGDYSKVSLESGAASVTGFDFDQQTLDKAYSRARAENLNFLPLYLDARNPSPDQGWMQSERSGFRQRFTADAVLALAFEHHLAIAHNVPLDQVVEWITATAPAGVIEFVPKADPTVVKMLALREDIFPDYTEEAFAAALARCASITGRMQVTDSGRTLFSYARD